MAARHASTSDDHDEYAGGAAWTPTGGHSPVVLPASSVSPLAGNGSPTSLASHSTGTFGSQDSGAATGSDTEHVGADLSAAGDGRGSGDESKGSVVLGGPGGGDAADGAAAPEPPITDADFVLTPFQVRPVCGINTPSTCTASLPVLICIAYSATCFWPR